MNLPVLFDSIILNAQGARTCYFNGQEEEAFVKLEQCQRTIAALRDFRDKVHALLNDNLTSSALAPPPRMPDKPKQRGRPPGPTIPNALVPQQHMGPTIMKPMRPSRPPSVAGMGMTLPVALQQHPGKRSRPNSSEFGQDILQHSNRPLSPYQQMGNELTDDEATEMEHPSPNGGLDLGTDNVVKVDEVFFGYLARVCSDLDATDCDGEKIHQTQTAKRLQGVSESDFNSFKFRISPFIRSFREELNSKGFSPEVLSDKTLKIYLSQQRYISRFNEDGRKAKSKGNHVWIVEAKKTADGGFIFREFERKITGPEPPAVARVGSRFRYEPRIFDPQCNTPKATFRSPHLPPWLQWDNNVLTGIVPPDATPFNVQVIGVYQSGDDLVTVEKSFHVDIGGWEGGPLSPLGGVFPDQNGTPYSPNGTLDSRTFVMGRTPSESIPTIAVDLGPKGNKAPQRKPSGNVIPNGMPQGMVPHQGLGLQPQRPPGRPPQQQQMQMNFNGNMNMGGPVDGGGAGLKRKRARPPQQQQQQQLDPDFSNALYQEIRQSHGQFDGRQQFDDGQFSDDGGAGEQHPGILDGYDPYVNDGGGYAQNNQYGYQRHLQQPTQYANGESYFDEDF